MRCGQAIVLPGLPVELLPDNGLAVFVNGSRINPKREHQS
jgi:hypothetical protein